MDWLRKSISAASTVNQDGRKEVEEEEEGEEEEEDLEAGKGVKEDLSELTKSLTRHIWGGVASFLAPPPPLSPSEEEKSTPLYHPPVSGAQDDDDDDPSSTLADLDDINLASEEPPLSLPPSPMTESPKRGDKILTGVRSDLAELKGTVAIGLSRFIKVVRDEIERDGEEDLAAAAEDEDEDENEYDEILASSAVLNYSVFKPLFGNILPRRENRGAPDANAEEEEEGVASIKSLMSRLDGVSRFTSTLFRERTPDEQKKHSAVGVTDDVLIFAENICMHPQTWLHFPALLGDEEDRHDFELTDAQKEHIDAVEGAAPKLAALRIELCPDYMSEGRFWNIYFVLLHSRLNKEDADLLISPQVAAARSLLLCDLRKEESRGSTKVISKESSQEVEETKASHDIVSPHDETKVGVNDSQKPVEKASADMVVDDVQNKTVLPSTVKLVASRKEEEVDDWPDEEPSVGMGARNEEDVSFSDLEDDDDDDTIVSENSNVLQSSSPKRAQGWIQLDKEDTNMQKVYLKGAKETLPSTSGTKKKSDKGESNDWLTVDEEDLVSVDSS